MNTRQISILAGVAILSVIGTLLITTMLKDVTAARVKLPYAIEYQVNETATELEITVSTTEKCSGNSGTKKGCFKIKKNDKGLIKYAFKDKDKKWQVKKFMICQGNKKITAACNPVLTLEERLDFLSWITMKVKQYF